jgi:hypothetical protein
VAHGKREGDHVAWGERLIERVNGIEVAWRSAYEVERPVELHVGDGLVGIGEVDLGDRRGGFVLQGELTGAVEGAALGVDVDDGIDRSYLRLGQQFVLLEIALIARLDVAAIPRSQVLIEHVRVVVIPDSRACGA